MTEGNYVRLLFGGSRFIEALAGLPVPFTPVLPGVLPVVPLVFRASAASSV